MVLAGAGTGKTSVITERIAHLILEHGVAPEHIVALTFTDKAAGEMEERLDRLLPYGMFGTKLSTFHSFCHEILNRHSYLIGIDANARLIGGAEAVSLLRANLDRLPLKYYLPPNNPVSFLRSLVKFVDSAKEEQITPEGLIDHATKHKLAATDDGELEEAELALELARVYAVVNQIYLEANILTYADLISCTLKILQTSKAALKQEQRATEYLLIDEFQDTNKAQAEIAYLLAGENANIFVVGDDDQAIYRFRGANIGNILAFREKYPASALITLTENFRSGQPILDTAYRLIQHNNPHRLEVIEKIDKRLHAQEGSATLPVEHLYFSHSLYEQEGVARKIEVLNQTGIPFSEIAILGRSHDQLNGFEQELIARGIPTNRKKEGSFYNQPAVQQALAYLRFLTKPDNSFNLFFLLSEAPFSISPTELRELNVAARKVNNSLWEQIANAKLSAELENAASYLNQQLDNIRNKRPTEALRLHIKDSRWESQLVEANAIDELSLLNTLYFEARSFEQLHKPALLNQYLAHIDDLIASGEDIRVENELNESGDGVQLLTIHASKGLEFTAVFIVNVVSDRFPSPNRSSGLPIPTELTSQEKDQVPHEEERRLAYVAMTRAKQRLFLTSAKRYEGNKRDKKPSVFLVEALGISAEPEVMDQPLTTKLQAHAQNEATVFQAPTTFTASALEAFDDSPERYLHEHVYRLIQEENAESSFGTLIHETLRAYESATASGESFDLPAYYENRWNPVGFENKVTEKTWKEEGLAAIQQYISKHTGIRPEHLEYSVELSLANGVKIIGKIDRIDRLANGRLAIIDYKTGRSKKPASPKSNLPLTIYAAALAQKRQEVESISLHYLMTDQELSASVDQALIEKTLAKVEELVLEIQKAHATNNFPKKS